MLCGALEHDVMSNDFNRLSTWGIARLRCESLGLSLATVRSEAENEQVLNLWLISTLNGAIVSNPLGIWIGLLDRDDGAGFSWISDSDTYRRWDDGEPNSGAAGGEACGTILLQPQRRWSYWDDRSCEDTYMYLCQGP